MKDRVSKLANKRRCKIGLIRTGFRLDKGLEIVEIPVFVGTLGIAMLLVGSVNNMNRHIGLIR